jgi:hypothetical protein
LLEKFGGTIGTEHFGEERREGQAAQAEQLVREELKRCRLADSDLAGMAKGDPRKVEIAERLRSRTVMTVRWIAERLAHLPVRSTADHPSGGATG